MKIHLIFAPTTFSLNYGDLGKGTDPPLGILYLASYLRKYGLNGLEIKVTDGLVRGFKKTLEEALSERADVIGISAVTPNILGAYELVNGVKNRLPSSKIVLGGPHPTAMPEEAFERSRVDAVVIGEGEVTFTELVNFYASNTERSDRLMDIDGCCVVWRGKPVRSRPREFIEDLDTIPFPARDLVDFSDYSGYPVSRATPSTSILTSRGCPFNCTFCSNNVWRTSRPRCRRRSPQNVANELEELARKRGFKEFFDYSDEFNTNLTDTKSLLREIISRKLSINMKCQVRTNPMDEELARLMRESGVWYVHLGIESGNEETLRGIRKKITLASVEKCCRILKDYDIKIWGLFMYFNIWEKDGRVYCENYEKSMNTFNYAKRLYKSRLIDYFGGSITSPIPGSDLWDIVIKHKLIKEEYLGKWDQWFYKRDVRLVSKYPGVPESSIFELHQKTVKYTIRSMLFGKLVRLGNLRFNILRMLYFIKRQSIMICRKFLAN